MFLVFQSHMLCHVTRLMCPCCIQKLVWGRKGPLQCSRGSAASVVMQMSGCRGVSNSPSCDARSAPQLLHRAPFAGPYGPSLKCMC